MKLIQKIRNIRFKIIANQLRLPSGLLAKLTGNGMNKANELLYRLTLNSMNVQDEETILEIGFGNGKYFSELNTKGKNIKIIGIDHSSKMVAEAIKRNKILHKSGQLEVRVGNSNQLPFNDSRFDKIFCINVIYFWENPNVHLKEIYRVLKPGGYFYTGFRPKENLSKFSFSEFGFTLYTEQEWKNLIQENGFLFIKSEMAIESKKTIFYESLCMVSVK